MRGLCLPLRPHGVALQSDSEIPSRRDVDIFLRLFEQLEKISAFPTFPLEDIDNVTLTFKRTVTISIVPTPSSASDAQACAVGALAQVVRSSSLLACHCCSGGRIIYHPSQSGLRGVVVLLDMHFDGIPRWRIVLICYCSAAVL